MEKPLLPCQQGKNQFCHHYYCAVEAETLAQYLRATQLTRGIRIKWCYSLASLQNSTIRLRASNIRRIPRRLIEHHLTMRGDPRQKRRCANIRTIPLHIRVERDCKIEESLCEGVVEDRVGIRGWSAILKVVSGVVAMEGRRNGEFALRVVR